ncbi:Uncharacterised protein [Brucella neotomae]|nr:Uncharacterised protein [Brucella neotomae]
MIVIIEACIGEFFRLVAIQHPQRHAGFQAHCLHAFDHMGEGGHVAILGAAPSCPHAIARGTRSLGLARLLQNGFDFHEFGGFQAIFRRSRLAAITAIFRASTRLDVEKLAELDAVRIKILAVQAVGAKEQIIERQIIDCPRFFCAPTAHRTGCPVLASTIWHSLSGLGGRFLVLFHGAGHSSSKL